VVSQAAMQKEEYEGRVAVRRQRQMERLGC